MRHSTTPVRLLLLMLLVLGVVGMHTIGHPPEARGAGHAEAMAEPASLPGAAVDCPDGHCAPSADEEHGSGMDGMGGMDLMSLCLAVALAAFVLVALVRLILRRAGRRRARPAVRGLHGRFASGLPPPRGPGLSRLSVLRI